MDHPIAFNQNKSPFRSVCFVIRLLLLYVGASGREGSNGVHLWGLCIVFSFVVALSAVPLADNLFDEEQKLQPYDERLAIRPYGPINPGDNVLQISLIDRESFRQILTDADTSQLPAIIHGSYQSGKPAYYSPCRKTLPGADMKSFLLILNKLPHPTDLQRKILH